MNQCICGYSLEITIMKNDKAHRYCMNPHCQICVCEEEKDSKCPSLCKAGID